MAKTNSAKTGRPASDAFDSAARPDADWMEHHRLTAQNRFHAAIVPGHSAAQRALETADLCVILHKTERFKLYGFAVDARMMKLRDLTPLDWVAAGFDATRPSEIFNYIRERELEAASDVSFLYLDPRMHALAEGGENANYINPEWRPVVH